ncbi:unnamed protein product [Lampetra planeri]
MQVQPTKMHHPAGACVTAREGCTLQERSGTAREGGTLQEQRACRRPAEYHPHVFTVVYSDLSHRCRSPVALSSISQMNADSRGVGEEEGEGGGLQGGGRRETSAAARGALRIDCVAN